MRGTTSVVASLPATLGKGHVGAASDDDGRGREPLGRHCRIAAGLADRERPGDDRGDGVLRGGRGRYERHQARTSAQHAAVEVDFKDGALRVVVEDDGRGGARLEPAGGLAGLAARVASVDGTFRLNSPEGGPTRVEAVIPCAL